VRAGSGVTSRRIPHVTENEQDVKMIVLTCPNCGADLQVSADEQRAHCDHCKSTVLIVDARKEEARIVKAKSMSPEEAAAARRMVKIILWVVGIAVVLPIAATIIVNILVGLVSLIVGIVTIGVAK